MDRIMIQNRLLKNYQNRKKFLQEQQIEAYRLYEKDIPDYPYIIDIYKDFAVIFEKGRQDVIPSLRELHQDHIRESLQFILKIPTEQMIFKNRSPQKKTKQYQKQELTEHTDLIIKESQFLFFVNLSQYLDTGLFLDHRPLRQMISKLSDGKKFLNLFSYTGSMSVAAALGGATTTSVDLSPTYQKWTQRNFALNQIPLQKHSFVVADSLEFLRQQRNDQQKYDLIFLDPPTFSNSKKMKEDFEVEKDHENLIQRCLDLLLPQGVLYFSNNKRTFKLADSLEKTMTIKDITLQTIPKDFRDLKIHHCFKIQRK